MLRGMQSTQIAVRIPDDLLADLDERIPSQYPSRAEAVRAAIVALVGSETLAERELRHRQGWARKPLTADDERTLRNDARSLIAEEPW